MTVRGGKLDTGIISWEAYGELKQDCSLSEKGRRSQRFQTGAGHTRRAVFFPPILRSQFTISNTVILQHAGFHTSMSTRATHTQVSLNGTTVLQAHSWVVRLATLHRETRATRGALTERICPHRCFFRHTTDFKVVVDLRR